MFSKAGLSDVYFSSFWSKCGNEGCIYRARAAIQFRCFNNLGSHLIRSVNDFQRFGKPPGQTMVGCVGATPHLSRRSRSFGGICVHFGDPYGKIRCRRPLLLSHQQLSRRHFTSFSLHLYIHEKMFTNYGSMLSLTRFSQRLSKTKT